MVAVLINWSLNNRFIVMLLAVVLLGAGVVAAMSLPLDAVPDLTNVQVQVLTTSPALGPVEVEQFITFPVENCAQRSAQSQRNSLDQSHRTVSRHGGFRGRHGYLLGSQPRRRTTPAGP
ncbi:MAG UNVERIFIED_CONTAM: efflux RND transporter permease subunit [Planctomycetaceae bacterium]